MKHIKWLFVFFLSLAAFFINHADVHASGYLPGGKNYLNPSHFTINGSYLESTVPIMVKPNQTYTLTIPKTYYDLSGSVRLVGLNQNQLVHEILFSATDFTVSSNANFYQKTFTSHPIVNYLTLQWTNPNSFFSTNNLTSFQLEEGNQFTGLESFQSGTIMDIRSDAFIPYQVLISNYDRPITEQEIMQMFLAHDAVYGNITTSIGFLLNLYQGHEKVLGDHIIDMMVEDEIGNGTFQRIVIRVVDLAKPILTGPSRITISYPSVRSVESILSEFYASDNVDGDVSNEIVVVSNEYHGVQTLGEYPIVLSITDTSGNTTTFETIIEVIDHQAPIITAPTRIAVGYATPMPVAEILALATAMDNHDGNLSAMITLKTNTYSSQAYHVGLYTVVYQVTDSSQNRSEHTMIIEVFDNVGPILYFDSQVIAVYQNQYITLEQITQLLIQSRVLEQLSYRVTVVEDHYTPNYTKPGNYHMVITFVDEYARSFTHVLRLFVKDYQGEIIINPPVNPPVSLSTFLQKNWAYLTTAILFVVGVSTNLIWWKIKYKK